MWSHWPNIFRDIGISQSIKILTRVGKDEISTDLYVGRLGCARQVDNAYSRDLRALELSLSKRYERSENGN